MTDEFNKPSLGLPLGASYNARGIAGFTNTITNAIDQRKINSIYEPVKNATTGGVTLYLAKRPGVADVGSTFGTTGQVAYLWDIAAGATTTAAANRWVFSTSGDDIRASDTSTTTVIATAAGYAPAFVDKTSISGADTLVVQLRNASGTQTAWHSSAIGTFTQISDGDFTGLAHQGKIEHVNGFAFIATRNRIYNGDINSLTVWNAASYIDRQAMQDIGTGMRHYSTTIAGRLYWRGSNPIGVFAFNGQTVEKVSTVAIDKILAERQHYNISTISFQGQQAVAICLDLPDAATQRSLLFFPAWNDWFEWSSTVFIPQSSQRLEDVCLGVGANQHKLYAMSSAADNWQDAGTSFALTYQFKLPTKGNARNVMAWFGVKGDTARSALSLNVEFSDDDWQTFSTARAIDMTSTRKTITRCGAYSDRGVRLSYTGALQVRLESAIARIA